ncbi:unnamed protein product, partial [Symbiodinium microadriaticum]
RYMKRPVSRIHCPTRSVAMAPLHSNLQKHVVKSGPEQVGSTRIARYSDQTWQLCSTPGQLKYGSVEEQPEQRGGNAFKRVNLAPASQTLPSLNLGGATPLPTSSLRLMKKLVSLIKMPASGPLVDTVGGLNKVTVLLAPAPLTRLAELVRDSSSGGMGESKSCASHRLVWEAGEDGLDVHGGTALRTAGLVTERDQHGIKFKEVPWLSPGKSSLCSRDCQVSLTAVGSQACKSLTRLRKAVKSQKSCMSLQSAKWTEKPALCCAGCTGLQAKAKYQCELGVEASDAQLNRCGLHGTGNISRQRSESQMYGMLCAGGRHIRIKKPPATTGALPGLQEKTDFYFL